MNRGFSLVEVVVGISIFAATVVVFYGTASRALIVSRIASERVQAAYLLEEGAEMLRYLRDQSWANISSPLVGTYCLDLNNMAVDISAQEPNCTRYAGFERTVMLSDICRDASGDITPCPGSTPELEGRKATIVVKWGPDDSLSETVDLYLFNLLK